MCVVIGPVAVLHVAVYFCCIAPNQSVFLFVRVNVSWNPLCE